MFSSSAEEKVYKEKPPEPFSHPSIRSVRLNQTKMNGDFTSTNANCFKSKLLGNKPRPPPPHLFGLAAGGSQQERIQHIFASQEEAVAVLVQVDGGHSELAVMAAEDGRAVGRQQICEREGGEKDEPWRRQKIKPWRATEIHKHKHLESLRRQIFKSRLTVWLQSSLQKMWAYDCLAPNC